MSFPDFSISDFSISKHCQVMVVRGDRPGIVELTWWPSTNEHYAYRQLPSTHITEKSLSNYIVN